MSNESSHDQNVQRRDFIKALATVPVFGFFLANLWLKLKKDALKRKNLLVDLVQEKKSPTVIKNRSNITACGGARTHDHQLKRLALYRLS